MTQKDYGPCILLVDDDLELRQLLASYLAKFDIRCQTVGDGIEMRAALAAQTFDLVLLDIMLPGESGLSLLQEIRNHWKLPVIMLTAKGEAQDRVLGLEIGADDYMVKPFDTRELVSRIHSLLRRSQIEASKLKLAEQREISFQGWRLDCMTRELRSPQHMVVPLSNSEFRLLNAFLRHPNQVLSRDRLLDLANGNNSALIDRSIDLMVSRLRQKIGDDPKHPALLKTIRGEGYLFDTGVVFS